MGTEAGRGRPVWMAMGVAADPLPPYTSRRHSHPYCWRSWRNCHGGRAGAGVKAAAARKPRRGKGRREGRGEAREEGLPPSPAAAAGGCRLGAEATTLAFL
jgi:hypothetical protein